MTNRRLVNCYALYEKVAFGRTYFERGTGAHGVPERAVEEAARWNAPMVEIHDVQTGESWFAQI